MKRAMVIWLAMAAWAGAAAADPGPLALRFLEKVREGKASLEPGMDTAISPQTSGRKRDEIGRRWERLVKDLGREALEVGTVKQDGELAAVILRTAGVFDPARLQVVPLAMVRREDVWLPAPVPASFENTGVGYGHELRRRLAALEDWMLRQRGVELEAMRQQAAAGLRRRIAEQLPESELRAMSSLEVGERFLRACEQRRTPEVLGLLGGMAAVPPRDWPDRLRAAEAAMQAGATVSDPWRMLTSATILRVIVSHHEEKDGQSASVVVAALDPERVNHRPKSTAGIRLLDLVVSRGDGDRLWRIDLPTEFLSPAGAETVEDDDAVESVADPRMLDGFPAKLAARFPASGRASAMACRDALLASLHGGSPGDWISLLNWAGSPAEQRRMVGRAAAIWAGLQRPDGVRRLLPLDFFEDGEMAAVACQRFDARHPDRPDTEVLFLQRGAEGWLWNANLTPEEHAGIGDWMSERTARWREEWQELLASQVPKVALPMVAPQADEARKVIEDWLECLRSGDATAALGLCARLDRADSIQTLWRNLGYELSGSRRQDARPQVGALRRGGRLAVVEVFADRDGKKAVTLYPVASTGAGPRVLIEIDLIAAGGRSRDFLNRAALDRLRQSDPEAARELEEELRRAGDGR